MINVFQSTVGILGAGTMGHGIAQACAHVGFSVTLFDVKKELAEAGLVQILRNLDRLIEKGKISSKEKDDVRERLTATSDLNHLNTDFIIEAAPEDLAVKSKLFKDLEKVCRPEAVFFTNTSSIPVTLIAKELVCPERLAGLHFFNPPVQMKLVEVIQGINTSSHTVDVAFEFTRCLGKQPVLVQDSSGFIVNRVARHFYLQALNIVEEGITDPTTVDTLMKSAGFKMGPFELMDLIGLDINLNVTKSLYNGFHQEPRFRPSRLQEQMVNAGKLGKKTGEGFYKYEKDI